MKYYSFFKLRFAIGLQYRFSALAGLATQFFWGMMMIFIYEAFFANGVNSPMSWNELVSYIWLGQAFYTIVFFRWFDTDIFNTIKTGQVAYEFVRPLNIYFMWYVKISAQRISSCILRILPIVIFSVLLPVNYSLKLPISLENFILFAITMFLGFLLSVSLQMLVYIFMFYTTSCKGIYNIFGNIADFFSGMSIPIPFMPQIFQTLCFILPFRLSMDLPMRLYVGNVTLVEGEYGILLQIAWILRVD